MKKLKTVFIIWIAIYPAITLLLFIAGDQLVQIPLLFRTLLLTGVLVPLMVYFLIPFWTWIFHKTEIRISAYKSRRNM